MPLMIINKNRFLCACTSFSLFRRFLYSFENKCGPGRSLAASKIVESFFSFLLIYVACVTQLCGSYLRSVVSAPEVTTLW